MCMYMYLDIYKIYWQSFSDSFFEQKTVQYTD